MWDEWEGWRAVPSLVSGGLVMRYSAADVTSASKGQSDESIPADQDKKKSG